MADTTKRDVLKIGAHVGIWAFIAKIVNVGTAGTIALSGDWTGLPDEQEITFGRMTENIEVPSRQGGLSRVIPTITGYEYKSKMSQRDAETIEFDAGYVNSECVLLTALHRFTGITAPAQQWLAIFGQPVFSDQKIASKDGYVDFTFRGLKNPRAIVMKATPASGEIAYPTLAGFTAPNGTITIAASDGGINGVYKISDIALA